MPSIFSMSCARNIAAGLVAVVFSLIASHAMAQRAPGDAGLFANLTGSWSGGGTITFAQGGRERIRCRAAYDSMGSGNSLQLELRCASDSYKFELRSNVTAGPSGITGQWNEATRNASGTVTGRATGDQIQALVDSAGFSASLIVLTRGDRQSVTIRTGGEKATEVAISLNRGR